MQAEIGTRFAELAQATQGRSELNDFGKCVALFVAAVGLAVENGYPLNQIDTLLGQAKAAAVDAAGTLASEHAPYARD